MVVEAKAMRCRDEGGTRIGLGLEGVVNLYRRTGLGFGREVHVEEVRCRASRSARQRERRWMDVSSNGRTWVSTDGSVWMRQWARA